MLLSNKNFTIISESNEKINVDYELLKESNDESVFYSITIKESYEHREEVSCYLQGISDNETFSRFAFETLTNLEVTINSAASVIDDLIYQYENNELEAHY